MMNAKFVRVAYFTPIPAVSQSVCSSLLLLLPLLCTGSAAISRHCAMRYAYAVLALEEFTT